MKLILISLWILINICFWCILLFCTVKHFAYGSNRIHWIIKWFIDFHRNLLLHFFSSSFLFNCHFRFRITSLKTRTMPHCSQYSQFLHLVSYQHTLSTERIYVFHHCKAMMTFAIFDGNNFIYLLIYLMHFFCTFWFLNSSACRYLLSHLLNIKTEKVEQTKPLQQTTNSYFMYFQFLWIAIIIFAVGKFMTKVKLFFRNEFEIYFQPNHIMIVP